MSQNKNAYEIRLEILKMAHDEALSKYHQKIDQHRLNASRNDEQYNITLVDSLFPKSEDIIARAEALYRFVEGR